MRYAMTKKAMGALNAFVATSYTLATLSDYAQAGVDRISVGALIKDIHATDFSMRFS